MFEKRNIYFYGLILLVIGLPLSPIITSISQLVLLANWVMDKDILYKLKKIYAQKSLLVFLLLYIAHILWLIPTEDFSYAFHDLKIKVPLLILPIIIATSEPISFKQIKTIILFFVASNIAGSLVSIFVLLNPIGDIREISVFISHIRFSLFINIAIFSLYYIILKDKECKYKILIYFGIIWLLVFLFILQSFTGIILFIIITFTLLIYRAFKSKSKYKKIIYSLLILIIPSLISYFIIHNIYSFYNVEEINKDNIELYTINGNKYRFDFDKKIIENNNYVHLYVCDKELKESWNRISKLKYDSIGKSRFRTKFTIIRYLTSKGYRKDSLGISKLTKGDIANIENGISNYRFTEKWSLYPRIYKLIWQLDIYNKTGKASGHTLTQRIEYLKTGYNIFSDNILFGVGTGDIDKEFKSMYNINKSQLEQKFRRRTHNQLFTFLISFGIIGFVFIVYAIVYPIIAEKGFSSFLFSVFIFISLFSMLNEDTLETQAGVTFFALFYSLFLFGFKPETKKI